MQVQQLNCAAAQRARTVPPSSHHANNMPTTLFSAFSAPATGAAAAGSGGSGARLHGLAEAHLVADERAAAALQREAHARALEGHQAGLQPRRQAGVARGVIRQVLGRLAGARAAREAGGTEGTRPAGLPCHCACRSSRACCTLC